MKWEDAEELFPGVSFLQLLFGYRSQTERMHACVDIEFREPARFLLESLFSVQASNIWRI